MASKEQEFNKYTEDIINEILNELIINKTVVLPNIVL